MCLWQCWLLYKICNNYNASTRTNKQSLKTKVLSTNTKGSLCYDVCNNNLGIYKSLGPWISWRISELCWYYRLYNFRRKTRLQSKHPWQSEGSLDIEINDFLLSISRKSWKSSLSLKKAIIWFTCLE